MNLQNTNEIQQKMQKRQEGKNKCKDKNLDNPSRLIEALEVETSPTPFSGNPSSTARNVLFERLP
jgi:hypothetical protein